MTKRFSFALIAISLVVVASYFFVGRYVEQSYSKSLESLNSQPNIKVSLINYKRGVFTSQADINIQLHDKNSTEQISIKQIITHGPVIASNTNNGPQINILAAQIATKFAGKMKDQIEIFTNIQNPITIVTHVDFSNNAKTWLRLSDNKQSTPTNFQVKWDPIEGLIEHDVNFAYYHGYLSLPNLKISGPEAELQFHNIALNLDAISKEQLYTNSNTLTTESITYTKHKDQLLKLESISAKLAFFTESMNLNLDMAIKIGQSSITGQKFKNDSIVFKANNLNRSTLDNFPTLNSLDAKTTLDLMQELTADSTEIKLELPKRFTEALVSYLSFEIYRNSYLGQHDKRESSLVLKDISGSINKLIQGAVQKELFLDKGSYYTLNFNSYSHS